MKTIQQHHLWRFGLSSVLICLWSVAAVAGVAPPVPTSPQSAPGVWAVPDYNTTANWANSPPLAKFVDTLPGLSKANVNNLGQYLAVGVPDTVTYPGSDYYEIHLVEYSQQLHSGLPATRLRGYKQVNNGTAITDAASGTCGNPARACTVADNTITPDPVRYLGPTIVAQRDRPVRFKFTNKLPNTANGGDLFIPVDTTIMGAGSGPASSGGTRGTGTPCDNTLTPNSCAVYSQNRGTPHLHGARTPWISDGTPHQWITPVDENTPYTQGVSVQNVPDMPDPGDGSMTFYYSNQQSARLLFYHDHAFGITRLNVYAGEVAGYVIADKYEQDLIARGVIPPDQIPLIIQDKTFVDATPTAMSVYNPTTGLTANITVSAIRVTDPLWNGGTGAVDANGVRPPVTGDLWFNHVYMPNQNPYAASGINPYGRWFYGPWFYPPTVITYGPVANPYFDADCLVANSLTCTTPGQPPVIPGTPNLSAGMESFMDTAIINGTAFPRLEVDPRAYRFRILNGSDDRGFNLSFYKADTTQAVGAPGTASPYTEIKMVPAAVTTGWPTLWPTDGRLGGVPDPGTCSFAAPTGWSCSNWGPKWIQIGTESGFLPKPVVKDPQPVTYITDPTAFWFGNVLDTSMALMPAERADAIVDFSAYAGQTLILYNDGPTAWPALDPRYDYFSGAPDQRSTGGYGTGGTYDAITKTWTGGTGPKPGYGPNTRTIMQVVVRPTAAPLPAPGIAFSQAALNAEFTSAAPATLLNPTLATIPPRTKTLFERAQEPIIVAQTEYQTAYPDAVIPGSFPWWGLRNSMLDQTFQFQTIDNKKVSNVKLESKAMHDEMGASFDATYGRMNSNLGMQIPIPTTNNANMIIYNYSDKPSEIITDSPAGAVQVSSTLLQTLADGTQIWNLSHNGVDTHPIHFHIFDVQLINRLGWDGRVARPDLNELGWKDTVRISPLEDTIVALRPVSPKLPFAIPNSLRPLNPAIPINSTMGFSTVDWVTNAAFAPPVSNILTSFGWEYVWHCHILSHEEMEMMRPIVLIVTSTKPLAPTLNTISKGAVLAWTDPTPVASATTLGNPRNEIGFNIQRCISGICTASSTNWTTIGKALANATTYADTTATASRLTYYRVLAYNAAGSTASNIRNVTTSTLVKPTVSLTAPANTAQFNYATAINITATAVATTGLTVSKVDFYVDGVLFGTSATPFSYNWTNATAGNHVLTAKATDSNGVVSLLSAEITITVLKVDAPASITVPTVSHTGSYNVSWIASATAVASDTYVLEESTTANFAAVTSIQTGTALSALITGKADGTVYYYRVKTVSTTLGSSAWMVGSNGCVVSYATAAPATITVPAASTTGNYRVSWSASSTPGATYTLEESTTANFGVGTSTGVASGLAVTFFNITGKSYGTYYYRVKAVAVGYSTTPWTNGANGCVVFLIPVITAPTTGTVLIQGVSTTITAAATAPSGSTVAKVEFYADGILIASIPAAPYRTPWIPATGTHNLSVFAYYSNNVTTMSDVVTVSASAVIAPITLVTPVSGSISDLGTPITISATATPPPGENISIVEFFADGGATPIGYSFGAPGLPFTWTWTPATAGLHTLTAKAYYNISQPSISIAVPVTVNGTVVSAASITVPASSTTGSYSVSWGASTTVGVTYTLQESIDPAFGTGKFTEMLNAVSPLMFTGKANGTYYYRVKAVKVPMLDSVWVSGQVAVKVPATATMLTPVVNSVIAGSGPTFTWTSATGASLYQIYIGTTPGAFDLGLFPAAGTAATTTAVSGLPTNGSTLYVRLWTLIGTIWSYNDYTYTAATLTAATMVTPTNLATISGASQNYSWTNAGASLYQLHIGTSLGASNLGMFPAAGTTLNTTTTTGLPTVGTTFVRLWSLFGTTWMSNDYSYTAGP